ncbi:hypothetical protein TRAPUB_2830 [Trametes pubescens]|uniref:Uncharacterized protein n=1 Tax=Trametes pubescens TaxID=154538 RepID=A0A1M2VFK6_TRAPU|nr:hypothetical protein TRAPUB_2830 [Trametes pubescens]
MPSPRYSNNRDPPSVHPPQHLLIQQLSSPIPPALLAAHVRLLLRHHTSLGPALLPPKVNTPEKILHVSRKYTTRAASSAPMWLARLDAERHFAQPDDVARAWSAARENVEGDGLADVWLWGLGSQDVRHTNASGTLEENAEDDVIKDVEVLEHLLPESKRIRQPAAASAIHEVLLMRYAAATHRALLLQSPQPHAHLNLIGGRATTSAATLPSDDDARNRAAQQVQQATPQRIAPPTALSEARLARVRRLGAVHTPSVRVWAEVFRQECGWHADRASGPDADSDARVLGAVYEFWRQSDGVEATAAWAGWLLRSGKSQEAVAVVGRARTVLGEQAGEEVERRWKAVLDGPAHAEEDKEADVEEGVADVTGEEP